MKFGSGVGSMPKSNGSGTLLTILRMWTFLPKKKTIYVYEKVSDVTNTGGSGTISS
jgi:hypothetical protein